jgi:hypothetical protein
MDTTLPSEANIWPTEDKSYNIWPDEANEEILRRHGGMEMLNFLRSTLEANRAPTEVRAERIVNDIYFLTSTAYGEEDGNGNRQHMYSTWILWQIFWSITKSLPYNHLYSETLVRAIDTITKDEEETERAGEVPLVSEQLCLVPKLN